jgi:hypothetical protein
MEKTFANDIYDKRIVSRLYKELQQINDKNRNSQTKKWVKYLNRYFS